MLQIVTKMYFEKGKEVHSTVHREALYSNRSFIRSEAPVGLPVGELSPSTNIEAVSALMLSVTEHLESSDSGLIATSGDELIDDIADVLAFGLNAVFHRNRDLVRNVVRDPNRARPMLAASNLFRDTFDPVRFVEDSELEEFRRFMAKLLLLRRDRFEMAMRAIRRIVRATHRSQIDPTLVYVDLVAALESLSQSIEAPPLPWSRMDGRKRKLFDEALEDADPYTINRVRDAAIEAERLGARQRFTAFVKENVSPEFFRGEAADAANPIRGADLERALKKAYDVRSRNVHVLEDLPPEAWVIGGREDTVYPPDLGVMLSLEGLARLARHVVRNYIERSPEESTFDFDWRRSIPGQLQMTFAPQYWLPNSTGFGYETVEAYFSGFVDHLMDVLTKPTEGAANMQEVLCRIEEQLPGTAPSPARTMMVAIYALWHRYLVVDLHRDGAEALLEKYKSDLAEPGMPSFVVGILPGGEIPNWSEEQWSTLATGRREDREKARHLSMPSILDSALQYVATMRLSDAGRHAEAKVLAGYAVEELPGNQTLGDWERGVMEGNAEAIDLSKLLPGKEED